ncbi:nucleotide synthetase [Parasphingorhabdus sp. DH2-15]|uniref:nucleotide synthetase n=1 Tax=Parasphingorhabdus sp. DH2-15 TaxID=3444112 RepID=UPI003F687172
MRRYFNQRQIKLDRPSHWNEKKEKSIKLFVNMDSDIGITYETETEVTGTTAQEDQNDYVTDALDFAIWAKYMRVEIYLNRAPANIEWRWSRKLDAFTTKDSSRHWYYGDLHYKTDNDDKTWVKARKWLRDDLYKESKAIMFRAKQAGGSKPGYHAYSLNIEIKQSDGRWLPITIDPDVRNPPTTPDLLTETINAMIESREDKGGLQEFMLFDQSIEA